MTRSVALVRRSFRPDGGAEHAIQTFAHGYKSLGFRVILLCEHWRDGDKTFDQVVTIDSPGLSRLARLRAFTDGVEEWMLENPDVLVQSHEWVVGAEILRIGDGLHSDWLEFRSKNMSPIHRMLLRFSGFHKFKVRQEKLALSSDETKVIIVNSDFVKRMVLSKYPHVEQKIHVIRNGCKNYEQLRRIPVTKYCNQTIRLGFFGSGWDRKGLSLVIRAMQFLPPGVRLYVAGRDKASASYRKLAYRLGVGERVVWLGLITDVVEFYKRIDCLILPSLYDPFPNVITEAMVAGRAVITTENSGGVDYQCLKAVSLCHVGDPNSLVAKVEELKYLTPEDFMTMRSVAEEFRDSKVMQNMRELLAKMNYENCSY